MTIQEISAFIAGGSAFISLVSVGFSIFYAKKSGRNAQVANDYASRANAIAVGQAENELRTSITHARDRYEDICIPMEDLVAGRQLSELDEMEKNRLKPLRQRQKSAIENLVNAYENACTKYIDDKIDKERFKKSFHSEIRNLFESKPNSFKDLLHPEGTSRFKALWKVYREWYDLENSPN